MKRPQTLALAAAAALALVLGTGCGREPGASALAPQCAASQDQPRTLDGLLLVAQSVPTARQLPCIANSTGWDVGTVEVRDGRSSFTLDAGDRGELKVTLRKDCDLAGTSQTPTDKRGTVRYDRIIPVDGGIKVVRNYTFTGGCVTYDFDFGPRMTPLVDDAARSLGFLSRAELDRRYYGDAR